MGIFSFFKKEDRAFEPIGSENASLSRILNGDVTTTTITREMAMQIPSVKSGIGLIADLVSSLEVKLYKESDGKVENIADDYRLMLLNDETGDMLNSYQMKQSITRDFLLSGNGYVYINRNRNKITSLHYIEPKRVSVIPNSDPIFKDGKILANGVLYNNYDYIIFAQNSTDGLSGKGLLEESGNLLELAYNTIAFSSSNMANGGVKRGVVSSSKRLSQEAMDALKQAWSNLYSANNTSSAIILNEGLSFNELGSTSAELEALNTRKANDDDILNLIKVPRSILDGTATTEQYNNFIKSSIIPILSQLESAFNKALLLESEKSDGYFFAFEVKDLLKGSAKERFETYKTAIESGLMSVNECRYQESLEEIPNMNILKMSLGNIIHDIDTGKTFIPNTGQVIGNKGIQDTSEKEVNTDDASGNP